jgi:hypothetical protein
MSDSLPFSSGVDDLTFGVDKAGSLASPRDYHQPRLAGLRSQHLSHVTTVNPFFVQRLEKNMETPNTINLSWPLEAFVGNFFGTIMVVPVLLLALVSQVRAQAPFDFSLSALGPHNVVQGRDLYINVSKKTLSGSGGSSNNKICFIDIN